MLTDHSSLIAMTFDRFKNVTPQEWFDCSDCGKRSYYGELDDEGRCGDCQKEIAEKQAEKDIQ